MTRDEQHAYNEGKFARFKDERDKASGAISRCPYTVPDRVRAWHKGYQDQSLEFQPKVELDAESEQRRVEFVAAMQDWLARNK